MEIVKGIAMVNTNSDNEIDSESIDDARMKFTAAIGMRCIHEPLDRNSLKSYKIHRTYQLKSSNIKGSFSIVTNTSFL